MMRCRFQRWRDPVVGRRWGRAILRSVGVCLALGGVPLAGAQVEVDVSTPLGALARAQAQLGFGAARRGDRELGRRRLEEAFALAPTPSLGLWLARDHAQRGELGEAALAYDLVEHLPEAADEGVEDEDARAAARNERSPLLLRLSTLTFQFVRGTPKADSVWMDGTSIDTRIARLVINPGQHLLRIQRTMGESQAAVEVGEGEHRLVRVTFPPEGEAQSAGIEITSLGSSDVLPVQLDELALIAQARLGSPAERLRATSFGGMGLGAFHRHELARAADALAAAFEILPLPEYALFAARAFDQQGQLTQAASFYRRATLGRADAELAALPGSPRVQAQAALRQLLAERLPWLRILLVDAPRADVELTLDGERIDSTMIGEELALDPGSHRVSARRGAELLEVEATLTEGDRRDVILQFHTGEAPAVAGAQEP